MNHNDYTRPERALAYLVAADDIPHRKFLQEMGMTEADEDRGNILLDIRTQLDWLRQTGFTDVDGNWKWLELGLFGGRVAKD